MSEIRNAARDREIIEADLGDYDLVCNLAEHWLSEAERYRNALEAIKRTADHPIPQTFSLSGHLNAVQYATEALEGHLEAEDRP